MSQLPEAFTQLMRQHLGDDLAGTLFRGLDEEPVTSVRLNPLKTDAVLPYERVPWCRHAYYLPDRPSFTFDPLFHAGVYYVQEASSMYLDEVMRQYLPSGDLCALDLCAAPGGKSTLIRSHLSAGSLLVSNEPIRQRANILAENMAKWGHPNSIVTCNYPQDFAHFDETFDFIVADVPCSGEGMFRKDAQAVGEWSLENVDACWHRQREIVGHVWHTLKAGGLMVYSTCTFNRFEDEDNARWIAATLGADLLHERHFIPGRDRGEGFYIAVLRKHGEWQPAPLDAVPRKVARTMNVLHGVEPTSKKSGKDDLPPASLPLSTAYGRGTYPEVGLTYAQAVSYLRREVLRIEAPKGLVVVTYAGHPLGFAKSVGGRLNNLYPQEWRIRTTYLPSCPVSLEGLADIC